MISHNLPTLGLEEENAALRVIHSKWVAQGLEVEAFENEFCEFLGLPYGHAVAVSSGTAALFLALKILKAENKNVALPVYACSAIRNAVNMARGKEVLIDIENGTPNIDVNFVKKLNVELMIAPHMFGIPQDLSEVEGVDIIEDCAQSLGAFVKAIPVGLQGRTGVFSFYASKLITSGGQGGMVVSKDKNLIDAIRDYREFDCRKDKNFRFNFQMTDLQAAIGRVQLKRLPEFLKRRQEIFDIYLEADFSLMKAIDEKILSVRYRAVLVCNQPQKIIKKLLDNDIKSIVPIEEWELLGEAHLFKNANDLTKNTVSLPIYPSLSNLDVYKIISVLKDLKL